MAKKNSTKKPAKRGRPVTIKWGSVARLWKTNTDKEIATRLGCTVPSVFNMRRKLAAQDASKYAFSGKAYTRTRAEKIAAAEKALAKLQS